jgi:hypothetical protein
VLKRRRKRKRIKLRGPNNWIIIILLLLVEAVPEDATDPPAAV